MIGYSLPIRTGEDEYNNLFTLKMETVFSSEML